MDIQFRPVQGLEADILNTSNHPGFVYFATDTKKIYLDTQDQSKLPMGGNFGFYYGNMALEETPDADQTEFTFSIYDIEGNSEEDIVNTPYEDDLILNLPDGCFYRVIENNGDTLITKRLTIAGSGGGSGGGGGGSSSSKSLIMNREDQQNVTILYPSDYSVAFSIKATDSFGNAITEDGVYELEVNGIKKTTGIAFSTLVNRVEVGKYLELGRSNKIKIIVSMDMGDGSVLTASKIWNISTTQLILEWNYDETTINSINENLRLSWSVQGASGFSKRTKITINNHHIIETDQQTYTITKDQFEGLGLSHGAHKFKLEVITAGLSEVLTSVKNIIIQDPNSEIPIVSCNFYETSIMQYNTAEIPIIIYAKNNDLGLTVKLLEDGQVKDEWTGIRNNIVNIWYYTPVVAGGHTLTISCGEAKPAIRSIVVQKVDIDNNEIEGFAFRLKANELASNTALQNWDSNGVTLTPSESFDWTNGGVLNPKDGDGQAVVIKAGSSLTINYPLFNIMAKNQGKTFKVIFKAVNCRNYEAPVLQCGQFRKTYTILSGDEFKVYLPIDNGTQLEVGAGINVDDSGVGTLKEATVEVFDRTSKESRDKFNKKYIIYNNEYYQCHIEQDKEDTTKYLAYWYKVIIIDKFDGLYINAQFAELNTNSVSIATQYCENTRIELEFDIAKLDSTGVKNYIKLWIDGVPCGYTIYDTVDQFFNGSTWPITIGSADCDVYLYMIKVYEKTLSDDDHLVNFIADAPAAEEMIKRFNRNNIKYSQDGPAKDISYLELAKQNPNCLVHLYDVPSMPTFKGDKKKGCLYEQYQGDSETPKLTASNVTLNVQGTSSERYVLAAANLDSDFTEGFYDVASKTNLDGWAMDENAIPIDYTCTKVNVASCENANNALNQEWYNLFQPYPTAARCKNPKARDTMQFTNGVLFIKDRNPNGKTAAGVPAIKQNVFAEDEAYMETPADSRHYKMYSIANMGNSKKNTEVFHTSNECCIEVKDNQTPQQKMISADFDVNDIGESENLFEFRYPKSEKATDSMKQGWHRLVSWMAKCNPQPKYLTHNEIESEKDFHQIATNWVTLEPITVYKLNANGTAYEEVTAFDANISTYYTETDNECGYTNLPLPQGKQHFDAYRFHGYTLTDEKGQPLLDEMGQPLHKDYIPLVQDCVESTYAGEYTHDTFEYRMAKMLSECEDYLVMDSIIYHYLFIEHYCMIDNVAKNTFWSSTDYQHWDLTKNYDNDTATGNDNNGHFTRTYGMETSDKLNDITFVFNAHQSVWLNFIQNLPQVCAAVYNKLEVTQKTVNGKRVSIWDKNDYLQLFTDWQSSIPERCWIEDYRRKYIRPHEEYNNHLFNEMMEGGQKKYQRKQFITYQSTYMSSKYYSGNFQSDHFWFRPTGTDLYGKQFPAVFYHDCYIHTDVGQQRISARVKRNEIAAFTIPVNDIGSGTMLLCPGSIITKLGDVSNGELGVLNPAVFSTQGNGKKLRELVISVGDSQSVSEIPDLKTSLEVASELLEKLYVANLTNYKYPLDLSSCKNLLELDARNSTFTAITFAENAPVKSIQLEQPTALTMKKLYNVDTFSINNYNQLTILRLQDVDYGAIDSKKMVQDTLNALSTSKLAYELLNINWELTDANDITDLRINLLDTLLNEHNTYDGIPTAAALTGVLNIAESAYNGNESISIYNEYANVYPNLNINFMGENAKLYTITIKDGDNKMIWTRKLSAGDSVTEEFLQGGPQGDFTSKSITKSPSPIYRYEFTNIWNVYKESNLDEIVATIEAAVPVYTPDGGIQENLVFVPIFTEIPQEYQLTFKGETDDSDVYYTMTIGYNNIPIGGTEEDALLFSEIHPYPYKDESDLPLKAAWDFLGYSRSPGGALVDDTYKATQDDTFYAIFKYEEDITKVVHEDRFAGQIVQHWNPGGLVDLSGGYQIRPRGMGNRFTQEEKIVELLPKGKITIPAYFKGKKVTVLDGPSSDSPYDYSGWTELTHVFMTSEDTPQVKGINSAVFKGGKLEYFDFTPNNIEFIWWNAFSYCTFNSDFTQLLPKNLKVLGNFAFQGANFTACKTTVLTIPDTLTLIRSHAFNALKASNLTSVIIPSTVTAIDSYAFAYWAEKPHTITFTIGSDSEKSQLEIPTKVTETRFEQNSHCYPIINFYTDKGYSDTNENVQVYFGGQKAEGPNLPEPGDDDLSDNDKYDIIINGSTPTLSILW